MRVYIPLSFRFVSILLFCVPFTARADVSSARWLVTAKISEAELIDPNSDGLPTAPSAYTVKLADVKVIQGEARNFPKDSGVTLRARNIDVAEKADRIYAVIEIVNDVPTVRYWEVTIQLACVPNELIVSGYEDRYFAEEWNAPNQKCTFVDTFQAPD